MKAWCVWTEWGAYEDFSRDLRGIFATSELAELHANQLRAGKQYDEVAVVESDVLTEIPVSVPYVRYTAHIRPDGTEDKGLGYNRGSSFSTWSNELRPLNSSDLRSWYSWPDAEDLYIEVIGSDEALVAAEYDRLLQKARS